MKFATINFVKILGIETSCDETAAAVVENGTKILSSVVASSEEIHQKYGGIIPERAAREQIRSIIPVIEEALEKAKSKIQNSKLPRKNSFGNQRGRQFKIQNCIDAIAVTVGPGLIGSLLVGIETAKTLAWMWNKPIVSVNHLIAHLYANFLKKSKTCPERSRRVKSQKSKVIFPAICLVVSGGHTELVLMKGHGKFTWLGGTRDDASGECFDKCARLLELGYPGGPAIERAASEVKSQKSKVKSQLKLPRPMINEDNFDFSFSGLKTAVLHKIKHLKKKPQLLNYSITQLLAYEIQEAITDVLVEKTMRAAKKYQVASVLVGGGVAANSRLREKLTTYNLKLTTKIFLPDKNLCTDNAAIVASAAYFNYQPVSWEKIKANPSLDVT